MGTVYRAAKRAELGKIVELWSEVFGVENNFFRSLLEADPTNTLGHTRVAVDDHGTILSTVQVFRRTKLGLDGRIDRIGGIGSVATRPEARGKGYSHRLLSEAIVLMREESYDYALLFTGINDFYARLGFRTVVSGPSPTRLAPLPPVKRADLVVPVMDLTVRTLRMVKRTYTAGLGRRPLADVRDLRQWRTAAHYRLAGRHHDFYVLSRAAGAACAYASVRWGANSLEVAEWGFTGNVPGLMVKILDSIRTEALSRGVQQVHIAPAICAEEKVVFQRLVIDPEPMTGNYTMVLPLTVTPEYLEQLFAHPLARCLPADSF